MCLWEGRRVLGTAKGKEARKECLPNLNSKRTLFAGDPQLSLERCAANSVGTSFLCGPLTCE